MSLKSFDKFCETLITSEPSSQKMIFDERQKQISSKITIEALSIYGIASALNTIVMEEIYQWCDSFFAPMLLLMAVCYLYWILRCYFSGALFGVNGAKPTRWSAIYFMIVTPCYILTIADDLTEEGGLVHDGMLSTRFVVAITFLIVFIGALTAFLLARKTDKAENTDKTDNNKQD